RAAFRSSDFTQRRAGSGEEPAGAQGRGHAFGGARQGAACGCGGRRHVRGDRRAVRQTGRAGAAAQGKAQGRPPWRGSRLRHLARFRATRQTIARAGTISAPSLSVPPVNRVSARELYDSVHERLALRWIDGRRGESRALEPGKVGQRRPSEVGYLNVIYPNKIQIIGSEELNYLDGLESRQRWETVQKIVAQQPVALIVTKDQAVPADLREAAEETATPLWVSAKRGHELLTFLQYHLARALGWQVTLHGVFLEVYSIGVLITGASGTGKSELALELVSRGHRLVADDAPEFTLIAPDVIDGTCPDLLRDLLEVRGLGVLNIREMFGHTAVKPSKYLRLIVHL